MNQQMCEVLLPSKVNGLLRLKRITTREDSKCPHPVNNSHKSLQYRGKTKRSVASSRHQAHTHRITWMIKPKTAILKPKVASATSASHRKHSSDTACHSLLAKLRGAHSSSVEVTGSTFPAITRINEIWSSNDTQAVCICTSYF